MKKMISYKLSLIVLTLLLLTGCGKEEKNIHALKWNVMLSPDISENVEETPQFFNRMIEIEIERGLKKLIYRKNPLEEVESATVSDGTYTITLGMPMEDLEYDEEELPLSGATVDGRVTDLVVEGYAHGVFAHPYNDFVLCTSAFNHFNGDFEGYYDYIHEIRLKTARFQTSDGFKIGMSEKELKDFYGDKLVEKGEWGQGGYFYQIYMTDQVSLLFVINTEGMINDIWIRTDYGKYH